MDRAVRDGQVVPKDQPKHFLRAYLGPIVLCKTSFHTVWNPQPSKLSSVQLSHVNLDRISYIRIWIVKILKNSVETYSAILLIAIDYALIPQSLLINNSF